MKWKKQIFFILLFLLVLPLVYSSSNNDLSCNFIVPPYCGDGLCNLGESCATCASDCGACPSGGVGGVPSISELRDWYFLNELNKSFLIQNNVKTRGEETYKFYIKNNMSDYKSILLTCKGDICEYIKFDVRSVYLPRYQLFDSNFTLDRSKLKPDESYVATIEAKTQEETKKIIYYFNTERPPLYMNLFNLCYGIIPQILIYLIIAFMISLLLKRTIKKRKLLRNILIIIIFIIAIILCLRNPICS